MYGVEDIPRRRNDEAHGIKQLPSPRGSIWALDGREPRAVLRYPVSVYLSGQKVQGFQQIIKRPMTPQYLSHCCEGNDPLFASLNLGESLYWKGRCLLTFC